MTDTFGPDVHLDNVAYIHPTVQIYGKVAIGENCSLWPYTVIRSEMYEVEIGPNTNIQDFAMIHVGDHTPTKIGAWCSITHKVTIHGATIGDNCLIGIGATVADGAVIGENSIVAGGSFVKEGTIIPPNSIVAGLPAKVINTRDNWVRNRFNAYMYTINAANYARGEHRGWSGPEFQARAGQKMAELQEQRRQMLAAE